MKKTAVIILTAAAFAAVSAPLNASAADSVNVSFSLVTFDENNQEKTVTGDVTVTDTDNDGELTAADLIYLAHEKYYPGGVAAGFGNGGYIWGIASGYTEVITDKNDVCVYSSSGPAGCDPADERTTLLDGDTVSWTPQWLLESDQYFLNVWEASENENNAVKVGEEFTVAVSVTPQRKADIGKVTAEGLEIWVDGEKVPTLTDKDGRVKAKAVKPGYQRVEAHKPGDETELCWYEILAVENDIFLPVTVEIYTVDSTSPALREAQDIYEVDNDGYFCAYDAIYSVLKRVSPGSEKKFENGGIFDFTGEFTVQINEGIVYPLDRADKMMINKNDKITVRMVNGEVTTSATTTTSTTTSTTTTTTTATNTTTTASGTTTTAGGVKTGDTMPVAALIFAALSAAGTAVVMGGKRREG